MTPTLFGLLRHGRTLWNEAGRIQGHDDSPLSIAGQVQVDQWVDRLGSIQWQRIISSDLGRAQETARRLNRRLGLPLQHDPRLREQDWGQWTGTTLSELHHRQQAELERQETQGWNFTPPDGEDRLMVLHRSREALRDAHNAHPGETILIVCHEGVIKALLYHLLNRRFLPTEKRILDGRALHLLQFAGDELRLTGLNHLRLD